MSAGERYPFEVAKMLADSLYNYLAPAATEHHIAGSVRRLSEDPKRPDDATCGDIELVLSADRQHLLSLLMAKPDKFRDVTGGDRLLKFNVHLPARGRGLVMPVQLNLASTLTSLMWGTVSNYGWKLLLATGDAEWNQFMVLNRKHGGLKPDRIHKAEPPKASTISTIGFLHINTDPQHTPTELEVFNLYDLPHVPPHRRNATTARELRARLALEGVL